MFVYAYTPFDNIRDILVAVGCTENIADGSDYFQIEIPVDESGARALALLGDNGIMPPAQIVAYGSRLIPKDSDMAHMVHRSGSRTMGDNQMIGTVHEETEGRMLHFVISAQSLTGFRHFMELLMSIPES